MPDITITTHKPHKNQQLVLDEAARFNVVACGRRWGKTEMGLNDLILKPLLSGKPVGWFAPTYKLLDEAWHAMEALLRPFGPSVKISKQERQMRVIGGGVIDFWTLSTSTEGKSSAGRGRKYARVFVDEAAHAPQLESDWTMAIRPTLSDLRGDAWFLSTPFGHNYFHRLWVNGQDGKPGWKSWQMPTSTNPYIHPDEIEAARLELPADAFAQEYEAEFLADAANPFGIEAIRRCITDFIPGEPIVWGVDLAKSHDWTVAIGLDAAGRVVAYQRWQSDWRNTAARVAAMIGNTPALVDSTGVGDPIVEQLQATCPLTEGYKFTMGSKQQLMEGLAVAIQQGKTSFPAGPIVNELEMFQYEYRPSGVRYTAPVGMHDDCVDSLALAVRCLMLRPQPVTLDVRAERWDEVDDDDWDWH